MSGHHPALTTRRLKMRQIDAADLPNIFKGLSNPDIVKYYGVRYDSLEATQDQMLWFAELEQKGTGVWWAVCDRKNGKFLGAGGFNNLEAAHQKAEIGFWLLPEYWGKGFMKESLPVICQFGFEQLNLHRIEGFVEAENTNCKRAMAKLDFVHEGTMKDCEVKDGRFISLDIYAMVKGV
jgi:ribosomal-protein-alanine N-acetyltransferase